MHSRRYFLQIVSASAALTAGVRAALSRTVYLGSSAWLEVRGLTGQVMYQRRQVRQQAWSGLRLTRVGDRLETSKGATATLALDQGIGTIHVAEKTEFWVKTLGKTAAGGRVTQIQVDRGQVRLKVRPFTHPSSSLEIHTPAGVAGVRGTDFGVVVQPSGKTSVATLSGRVDTIAQRQTVPVGAQYQNLTIPLEPPQPPVPLRDDPEIQMSLARREKDRVLLMGQTDPVNLLLLEGQPQDTDREGNFNFSIPVKDAAFIVIQVITPLGTRKRHELPIR